MMHIVIGIGFLLLLWCIGMRRVLIASGVLLAVVVVWDMVANEIPYDREQERQRAELVEWCKHPTPNPNLGPLLNDYLQSDCPGSKSFNELQADRLRVQSGR